MLVHSTDFSYFKRDPHPTCSFWSHFKTRSVLAITGFERHLILPVSPFIFGKNQTWIFFSCGPPLFHHIAGKCQEAASGTFICICFASLCRFSHKTSASHFVHLHPFLPTWSAPPPPPLLFSPPNLTPAPFSLAFFFPYFFEVNWGLSALWQTFILRCGPSPLHPVLLAPHMLSLSPLCSPLLSPLLSNFPS